MLNAFALKIIAGIGAILLLVILVQDRNAWKAKAAQRQAQIVQLKKDYESASREAELRNKAQVQKIEAQHEAITNNVRSDYARDLERLRQQANRGSTSGPGVSGVPKAPGGADGENLPLPAERVLPLAQEVELKCNALVDWLNEQMGVRP